MKLKTEISELKQQIEHFEGALSDLGKPSEKPSGNQLAQVLQARFERLDDESERKRSLDSAKSLLAEAKQKLEYKEKEFKRVSQEVKNGQSRISLHASRINQLSHRLKLEIEAFNSEVKSIQKEWPIVYREPLVNIYTSDVVLPFVTQVYSSDYSCMSYQFSLIDSSSKLPEKDPFASMERSLSMAR